MMMIGDYAIRHEQSSLRASVIQRFAKQCPAFIETGSNVGAGIQEALTAGFEMVYSVEGLKAFYDICYQKYSSNPRVQLYCGYSPDILKEILLNLDKPAVIYLDAHSIAHNPLLEELKVIRDISDGAVECGHPFKHVIMIDDVRMFDTADWHGIKRSEAIALLRSIYTLYNISYVDTINARGDLLVAC